MSESQTYLEEISYAAELYISDGSWGIAEYGTPSAFVKNNPDMICGWKESGLRHKDIAIRVGRLVGKPISEKTIRDLYKGISLKSDTKKVVAIAAAVKLRFLKAAVESRKAALILCQPGPAHEHIGNIQSKSDEKLGSTSGPVSPTAIGKQGDPINKKDKIIFGQEKGKSIINSSGAASVYDPKTCDEPLIDIPGEFKDTASIFFNVPRSFGLMRLMLHRAVFGGAKRCNHIVFEDGEKLHIPVKHHRDLFSGKIINWAELEAEMNKP